MTSSVVTGDCISQKIWHFRKTTLKQTEFGTLGGSEPDCLEDTSHWRDRCNVKQNTEVG